MTVRHNKVKMTSSRVSSAFAIPALVASMVAISSTAYADQRIDSISVVQTAPAVTQLRLGFTEVPVIPAAYQLNDPSRLVLDFEQVQNGLANRFTDYNIGMINEVTTLSNESTTRLIVELKKDGDYTTAIDGNDLLLSITDNNLAFNEPPIATTALVTPISESSNVMVAPIASAPSQPAPTDTMVVRVNPLLNPGLAASQVSKQYSYDGLTSLDFEAGVAGGGDISMSLANEAIPIDVQRQGNKLVVRLTGSTVPRNLLRRLNINSGLVDSIDTKNQGQNGVITINMKADYEYQAYQSGNQLNISISEPKLLREPTLEERVYTGEPLSMEFQDVEIRSVLDILAQFTEMNIIASDAVAGNITLRLINVPWDQALDIILKSKALGKRANGNVILVAPAAELATQEAQELEAQKVVEVYTPLRTEYIRLSYAKAQDILALISQGSGSGGGADAAADKGANSGTLLSNRGTVTVDNRTNTLIIKDVADSIENIRKLISKIDIPVRQVMIEARIVSASDSFSKEIGVSWGILSNGAATNSNLLVGGSQQTLWDLKDFDVETTTVGGQTVAYPSYDISRPDNLSVDLGATNPAGRIAFGLIGLSDFMLDLELSAMQADNRGEVISTPKILTVDKQMAKISSGTQIPFLTEADGGGTTIEFKPAVLSLEATPNITPDGKIGLKLDILNAAPNPNNDGSINEDALSTNVIVEDGQTIVLGGVFKNRVNNSVDKVPFLGDLPFIGKAFRRDVANNSKQELLIFITTKLVNDGVSQLD